MKMQICLRQVHDLIEDTYTLQTVCSKKKHRMVAHVKYKREEDDVAELGEEVRIVVVSERNA